MVKRSNYLTRAYRVMRMLVHLIYAIAVIILLYRWMPHRLRSRIERRWSKGFLKILNIQVKVQGVIPDLYTQNIMLVANHISWLDVYLLSAVRPARFVSKAEVRAWPVIGWLAHKTGTLFIDRTKRHDTARINDEISSSFSKAEI